MTSVSIAELKAYLSHYIRKAREGGKIEMIDRGKPVARITSPQTSDDKALDAMVKAGLLTRGNGRAHEILDKPPIKLQTSLSAAVIEDREDRV